MAAKAAEYERWLEERLAPDLAAAKARRAELQADAEGYRALRRNLEMVEEHGLSELELLAEVGADVYARAEVPDTRRVFVLAGLGFHVECTLPEARALCTAREELLAGREAQAASEVCRIQATVKLVLEGVRELRGLPAA